MHAIRVPVETDADVDAVVEEGLAKVKINDVSPDRVTVKFDGVEVDYGALASEFKTTREKPLIFEINGE